jgi:hypothetical protein
MDRSILFAVLTALAISCGCLSISSSDDEEDAKTTLSHSYSGTLDITYSRDFPSFEATTQAFVSISKEGIVGIIDGTPAIYDADDILQVDGGQMRQRETGTLSHSGGSGVVIIRGEEEFVSLSINVNIKGEQETFAWDEDTMSWISVSKVPFDLDDPIEPPVEFNIYNATAGDGLAFTTRSPQISGYVTYEWKLFLIPSIPDP